MIKPLIFSKTAILSQIDSYLRFPVRTLLKVLKYLGLIYDNIEFKTSKYYAGLSRQPEEAWTENEALLAKRGG